MADLVDIQRSDVVRIVGGDELYAADVILENGKNKLVVKSSNAPQPVGDLAFIHAKNGTSIDMNVNGSVTPVTFTVSASATKDLIVDSMVFESLAGGIKIDKFLSLNSALTNGLLIEIKAENEIFQFLPIQTTQEFDSHFAYGSGRSFEILFASGSDSLVARYGSVNPFVVKKQGTYGTDDYVKVIIRDNLSTISKLSFLVYGAFE